MEKKISSKSERQSRYLKRGGYSVAVSAVFIVIVILINLIVSSLPSTYTKIDCSALGIFTLDKQTENIVSSVKEDITIYHVYQSGMEDATVTELLARYSALSSKIKIKTVDPVVQPAFVSRYTDEAVTDNSLIVESSLRSKVVNYEEIYYTDYSNITEEEYNNYLYYGVMPSGTPVFAGENALTGAIDYVTVTDIPNVYQLTGHGEASLDEVYASYVTEENFVLNKLSLLQSSSSVSGDDLGDEFDEEIVVAENGNVPEDCDLILINYPTSDLSDAELSTLLSYVKGGGKLVVLGAYKIVDLDNFVSLAAALGMEISGSLVVEGSGDYYYQRAYYLLPTAVSHEITDPLIAESRFSLFANSHALKISETFPEGVTAEALFTTSKEAFAKGITNFTYTSKEEGDKNGPFDLAVLSAYGEGEAVWFASPHIADSSADNMVSGGNSGLFLNTLGYLCGKSSSVTVRTINLTVAPLTVTGSAATLWTVIAAAVLPIAFAAAGIAIWYKRRRS